MKREREKKTLSGQHSSSEGERMRPSGVNRGSLLTSKGKRGEGSFVEEQKYLQSNDYKEPLVAGQGGAMIGFADSQSIHGSQNRYELTIKGPFFKG